MRVYIATEKSKKMIRQSHRDEKKGIPVNWEEVLNKSYEARAKTKEQMLRTAGGIK